MKKKKNNPFFPSKVLSNIANNLENNIKNDKFAKWLDECKKCSVCDNHTLRSIKFPLSVFKNLATKRLKTIKAKY